MCLSVVVGGVVRWAWAGADHIRSPNPANGALPAGVERGNESVRAVLDDPAVVLPAAEPVGAGLEVVDGEPAGLNLVPDLRFVEWQLEPPGPGREHGDQALRSRLQPSPFVVVLLSLSCGDFLLLLLESLPLGNSSSAEFSR